MSAEVEYVFHRRGADYKAKTIKVPLGETKEITYLDGLVVVIDHRLIDRLRVEAYGNQNAEVGVFAGEDDEEGVSYELGAPVDIFDGQEMVVTLYERFLLITK